MLLVELYSSTCAEVLPSIYEIPCSPCLGMMLLGLLADGKTHFCLLTVPLGLS
jgi:hypothetical protein